MKRWELNSKSNTLDGVASHFDRFFSAWVLYNYLYEALAESGMGTPRNDTDNATKMVRKLLGADCLYKNPVLQKNAGDLVSLFEGGIFYIREGVWDAERVRKLKCEDPPQWVKGLLEVIYQIRCNIFHGGKEFKEEQVAILKPCIAIIEELNDLIFEKIQV